MTRATLLAPPYQVQDGRWRAFAEVDISEPTWVRLRHVSITPEQQNLNKGDTIKVTREGDEWRAV